MPRTLKNNTVAGGVAACTSAVVGHPFNTITVRMQSTGALYRNTFHCFTQTVKLDGIMALYRGFIPEMFARLTGSALRFTLQAKVNQTVSKSFIDSYENAPPTMGFNDLPLHTRVFSEACGGAMCGVLLPLILTPTELIKCKRQVLPNQSIMSICRGVVMSGGLLSLYTGYVSTMARFTLGNFVLFGSYQFWKSSLSSVLGVDYQSVTVVSAILSGCTVACATYPIDAAKSRQQVFVGEKNVSKGSLAVINAKRGLLDTLRQMRAERSLYRGMSAVFIRTIPFHTSFLPVYDLALQYLNDADDGILGGGRK
eukprot:g1140.t1